MERELFFEKIFGPKNGACFSPFFHAHELILSKKKATKTVYFLNFIVH